MARLTNNPTKEQEIIHFNNFLTALPQNCYLRSILEGAAVLVEGEIKNDFGYPALPELRKQQLAVKVEIAELELRKADLQRNVKELEAALERIVRRERDVRESLTEAQAIAQRIVLAAR